MLSQACHAAAAGNLDDAVQVDQPWQVGGDQGPRFWVLRGGQQSQAIQLFQHPPLSFRMLSHHVPAAMHSVNMSCCRYREGPCSPACAMVLFVGRVTDQIAII